MPKIFEYHVLYFFVINLIISRTQSIRNRYIAHSQEFRAWALNTRHPENGIMAPTTNDYPLHHAIILYTYRIR